MVFTDCSHVLFTQGFNNVISPLQGMFDDVDGVENSLRRHNVISPAPMQTRLDDLHRRWKELQLKMLNRENTIQENITEYDMNVTQEPLQGRVCVVRRVAHSREVERSLHERHFSFHLQIGYNRLSWRMKYICRAKFLPTIHCSLF